jgi:hypothetical protein
MTTMMCGYQASTVPPKNKVAVWHHMDTTSTAVPGVLITQTTHRLDFCSTIPDQVSLLKNLIFA